MKYADLKSKVEDLEAHDERRHIPAGRVCYRDYEYSCQFLSRGFANVPQCPYHKKSVWDQDDTNGLGKHPECPKPDDHKRHFGEATIG